MEVFEPFTLRQFQVIDALKKYGIISQERSELGDYTHEEDRQLRGILLTKWKSITFDEKVIFHALNGSLPYWGFMYPAIPQ
jgi:hypothetical protein